jgi:phosphatidylserine/phosphatidylglycerophosphate/cardiolipin synthase-like enzyme
MSETRSEALAADAKLFEATTFGGRFQPQDVPRLDHPTFQVNGAWEAGPAPDCSYGVLSAILAGAARTLDIYIYNLTGKAIADLIIDRLDAGVAVRILYDPTDPNDGRTEAKTLARLAAKGAQLLAAPSRGPNSVFTVCHQKLVIADGVRFCLGSANWGETGFPNPPPARYTDSNREWVISVEDRALSQWWLALFQADWDLAARPVAQDALNLMEAPTALGLVVRPGARDAPPGPFRAFRKADATPTPMTPVTSPDSYAAAIGDLIDQATSRIYIQQQYILLSGPSVRDLLARLRARAEAGVDVKLITSPTFRKVGKLDNWELSVNALAEYGMADRLRAMNIKVFGHLHNKGLVVDDKVVITSTNWSDNSISRGREAGLIVEHADLADYFAEIFLADYDLAWPSADVAPNVAAFVLEAAFQPDGFVLTDPADLI